MNELGQKILIIEASEIKLTYQDLRLKDASREKLLLSSIAEHGIQEPLWGVTRKTEDGKPEFILLDGFKRYVGVHGNFYWVPGSKREPLKAIEYAESIRFYRGQNLLN